MKFDLPAQASTLKVASGFFGSIDALDPVNITTMYEYEILENLYGNLLEYDDQGHLVADVPDSFKWIDRELIFTFGTKATMRSGKSITADDAAISIKRSILFQKSGHGDIRNFLCPNHQLTSIDDDCPGIRVDGNKLILTAYNDGAKLFLTTMLESADFGIVPRSALGPDPTNPQIVDRSETSGAYYLEKLGTNGPITLSANLHYHHYHPDMPAKIEFIRLRSAEAVRAMHDGRIDLMPASVYLSGEDAAEVSRVDRPFNVLESLPIQVYMLCFSAEARRKFTPAQRFFVGGLIGKWVVENRSTPESSLTQEFFQGLSDGALTAPQKIAIRELRSNKVRPKFERPIELSVNLSEYEGLKAFLSDYPEIDVTTGGTPAYLRPVDKKPDIYIIQTDSAWSENINLLGYNFNVGTFHLDDLDGDRWVKEYVNTPDRNKRMERLRELHFNLLKNVVIYPILASSYLTISNKAWTLPLSTLGPGPELWKIRTQR